MHLPANSDSIEPGPRKRRFPAVFPSAPLPGPKTMFLAAAVAGLIWAVGCTESEWPDRDPLVVDEVPVDSLEFLPPGARFALEDSLTPVLFRGFRAGYACTQVQLLELEPRAAGPASPSGLAARVRLQLPGNAACPVEASPRDDSLLRRFARGDGPTLRLLDTVGGVLDSVALVRGVLAFDSLELEPPALSTSRYRFFYDDTAGGQPRLLSADSLNSCEFLNHADYLRSGDTVRVRYSWVTLDPAPENDSCRGDLHGDALEPLPRRP